MSESELLVRVAKLYLQRWRGGGRKSATARRYNVKSGVYRIRPWYVDRVLYSVLWQRAIHSGESISRMVDFAVRFYLPRLIEVLLAVRRNGKFRTDANIAYWAGKSAARKAHVADAFINYACETHANRAGHLSYTQTCLPIPKKGLTPGEILHWLRCAA